MPRFKMFPLRSNNVLQLHAWRDKLNLDPPYQRLSVWDTEKQQTFIDSVINGFDVPKLYFHEAASPNARFRYSVIDGKQRIQALWEFMDNKLPLGYEFVFFDDETLEAAGAYYEDLMLRYPRLRARFDDFEIPITVVQTDDENFIESLFARLNVQIPLTAPERRNAFGGPLPYLIRKVGVHPLFTRCSRIPNLRLQHFDLAAKFLYVARSHSIATTKREQLDTFVRQFKRFRDQGRPEASQENLDSLESETRATLDMMAEFFEPNDPLLQGQGRVTLYFHMFRIHRRAGRAVPITRIMLEEFNEAVASARKKSYRRGEGSDEALTELDHVLLAFDRDKQSINDASALTRQYRNMSAYFERELGIQLTGE